MSKQQPTLFDLDAVERVERPRHNCRAAANRYRYGSTHEDDGSGLSIPLRQYRCRACGHEWTEVDL